MLLYVVGVLPNNGRFGGQGKGQRAATRRGKCGGRPDALVFPTHLRPDNGTVNKENCRANDGKAGQVLYHQTGAPHPLFVDTRTFDATWIKVCHAGLTSHPGLTVIIGFWMKEPDGFIGPENAAT